MGQRFKNQHLASFFFVTTSFYERNQLGWKHGVYEALRVSIKDRLIKTEAKLIGYVFMPSHIHIILFIQGELLSGFMRDFKKYTSQKSLRDLRVNKKLWQDRFNRVAILNNGILKIKLEYVHYNPVKAGLVKHPQDWKWSSASDYINNKPGPLPIWKEWS